MKTLTEFFRGHCLIGIHDEKWGVTLTTTEEAVNSLKRKKILNIYSVTVQNIIGRYKI